MTAGVQSQLVAPGLPVAHMVRREAELLQLNSVLGPGQEGSGVCVRAMGSIYSFALCSCSPFLPLQDCPASFERAALGPPGGRLPALRKERVCCPVIKYVCFARKLLLRQQEQSSISSSWLLTVAKNAISLFLRFLDALKFQ